MDNDWVEGRVGSHIIPVQIPVLPHSEEPLTGGKEGPNRCWELLRVTVVGVWKQGYMTLKCSAYLAFWNLEEGIWLRVVCSGRNRGLGSCFAIKYQKEEDGGGGGGKAVSKGE